MVDFDLWGESFIFAAIYSVIIIVPCILIALMGRAMIQRLGQYPSKTPVIQMSIAFKLFFVETIAFTLLVVFYQIFRPS